MLTVAQARGFETRRFGTPSKPILVATVRGSQPHLKALQLNSHYDVVPAEESKWTLGDPWAGSISADGKWVVGRGAQDMKCVCVQHLEGLYRATRAGPLKACGRALFSRAPAAHVWPT